MPYLSFVIPVFNEEASLAALFDEICAVAKANNYSIEVIFVDDGSTDGSWKEIATLASRDSRVRGFRLRANTGKAAALDCGFQAAKGDVVFTLDADLQDDPGEVPRLLKELDSGDDVVSGWKIRRQDPWHKVWPSKLFNWTVRVVTGVALHDHNCGMKCYRREALADLRLYGELHRFIPVLLAAKGYRVGEVPVQHRARLHGQSKYGARRFTRGLLDLITVKFLTRWGDRPMHFFGTVAIYLLAFPILNALFWYGVAFLIFGVGQRGVAAASATSTFAWAIFGPLAMVCILFGLVSELIVAERGGRVATYSVRERTDDRKAEDARDAAG